MLRGAVPLGRIAGVRIYAHWSLVATLGLIASLLATTILPQEVSGYSTVEYWLTGIVTATLFLVSLAAHELAHSIVALRHGVAVERVTLWLLGGMSELSDEPPDPRADLRIAIVGPLTSFAIGFASLGLAYGIHSVAGSLLTAAIAWLGSVNVILAIFNLLPGAPLDGGRVLRAILWRRSGDRLRAMTSAARSGRVLGMGLILIGLAEALMLGSLGGLWLMLLGWFLRTAANVELMNASMRHKLGDAKVEEAMTTSPVVAPADWTVEHFLRATVSGSHHRLFPVVDGQGLPNGVVSLADLSRVPPESRSTTSVGSIARALPAPAYAHRDDLLATVATKVILRPGLDLVAVVDDSRLTGIVTATDLVHACDRTALGLYVRRRSSNLSPQWPPPEEQRQ
ncbi:MAG: site-2 protease family protein [Mycobacteriaceae bacterium]